MEFCTTDQLILRAFNDANGVLVDALELGFLWDKIRELNKHGLLIVTASTGPFHRIHTTEAGIIFSRSYNNATNNQG